MNKVVTEQSETQRVMNVLFLLAYLAEADRSQTEQVDARSIEAIAGLLNDEIDSVRAYAAIALGDFGAAAIHVVPALHEALAWAREDALSDERRSQTFHGFNSGDSICEAFNKIGMNPDPDVCVGGAYYPELHLPSEN